ncbi:hypothetical protein XELAEV_18040498mg [Xenopus laevis]|uniref:Ig-like domain-containing protein n=1 Tax=Xenopus laevis TaxID=8355 RepID=A0A974C9V4_XENLA|nr:hypothetical protein XELAEV_18040498mg [Xenopus laevis]
MKFTEILFVILTLSLGTYAGGDIPLQVTGRVGETVTLTPRLNLTHPIDTVTWMYHINGKRTILAEFREQKFIRVNKNYFINRLEGSNSGTSLQIRELRMEDSGVFTAQINVNEEIRDISYNLTVYESLPLPTPVINKTLDENSTDLCHLHCSVPSNSTSVSYSWIYRDKDTDILYANGSTISVSLKDKTLGTQFICLVQNPAHTNNVSVLLYPCDETQTKGPLLWNSQTPSSPERSSSCFDPHFLAHAQFEAFAVTELLHMRPKVTKFPIFFFGNFVTFGACAEDPYR